MKTLSIALLLFMLLASASLNAQNSSSNAEGKKKAKDTSNNNVFLLDVGTPKASSLQGSLSKLKLEVWTSDVVSIGLVHCNPFKYTYKLHATPIDLFAGAATTTDTLKMPTVSVSDAKVNGANTSDLKAAATSAVTDAKTNGVTISQGAAIASGSVAAGGSDSSAPKRVQLSTIDIKKANELIAGLNKAKTLSEMSNAILKQDTLQHSDAFGSVLSHTRAQLDPGFVAKTSILELDQTITNDAAKTNLALAAATADSAIKDDTVAQATSIAPVSGANLSILITPLDSTKSFRENLILIWEKMFTSMDVNLCQMQSIQEKMMTYNMLIKSIDNFDKDIFRRYREGFRKSMSLVVSGYNRMINDFNSRTITDTLDKFNTFQAKTKQFIAVKEECDKLLSQFYIVSLNNYLLPLDINGKNIDMVDFNLERWDAAGSRKIDEYDYQIWIKGGLKFDLSAGGFITSLMDDAFITQDVQDNGVTKKKILTDPAGSFKLGFGTMVNMSYRTGRSWVKPGLSLGIVFTTSESFQILTGPSVVLGKMERAILHFGLAIGNVSRLRPEYKVNEAYDFGSTNTVPTAKVFKAGYFFGLTYNLTKVKSNSVDAPK